MRRDPAMAQMWTNEAARILWYGLGITSKAGRNVSLFIDDLNVTWFPEGTGCKATPTVRLGMSRKDPQVDIAVVDTRTQKVLALLEVEETQSGSGHGSLVHTADNVLSGLTIEIPTGRPWTVTAKTRLGLLFYSKSKTAEQTRLRTVDQVYRRQLARRKESTPNSRIEIVTVGTYGSPSDLKAIVEEAMGVRLDCESRCIDRRCKDPGRWTPNVASQRTVDYLRTRYLEWKAGAVRKEKRNLMVAAEQTGIKRGYIGKLVGLQGAVAEPNEVYVRAMAKAWGFPVIDFYIRGGGSLQPQDVTDYIEWLQRQVPWPPEPPETAVPTDERPLD